jgi:hypothetical protein
LLDLDEARGRRKAGEFLDHLKTSPFVAVVMGPGKSLVVYHTASLEDVQKIREALDELAG